jgi:ankyrin repeat protein
MNTRMNRGILVALAAALAASQLQAAPAQSVVAAVKSHDVGAMRALLKKGADVSATDVDGTTPLMLAVQERDAGMVQALLAAGAHVDAANRYGATALHTAARNGDAKTALLLLKAGANASAASPEGETVLMAAAKTGNVELINALLKGGKNAANKADPNYKEGWKGQTALMWAAAEGHADAVTALVAGGARVDEASTDISLPAVDTDRRIGGFVYSTIPKGKLTALHFAARAGQLEAVRALIKAHANLDVVDSDGTNALVIATMNGHPDIALELMNAGADPKVADKYGRTVLFAATDMNTLDANPRPAPMMMGDKTYVDVVKAAIARGADVNATLKAGLPNWVAQGGSHNPILREGATTFLRASMSGDLTVMNLLLQAGADPKLATVGEKLKPYSEGGPDRENFGETNALQAAAGVGWRDEVSRGRDQDAIETIKLLIARGADINAANGGGNTPLHGAAMRGSPAIVEFLLKAGADPARKNARGMTAMDIAKGEPRYRIPPNQAVTKVIDQYAPARVSAR